MSRGSGDTADTAIDEAPPAVRGRPRAADRTPAILQATMELVDEIGYDQLRVQDVADRAGVGLATIYRRWPSKKELFLEALQNKPFDLPDTGDPRADLQATFEQMLAGMNATGGCLFTGCLAAGRDEPEVLEMFREVATTHLRSHLRLLISRILGDDDPDLDLRCDLAPGLILHRSLGLGQQLDDDLPTRLTELTLAPFPHTGE